MSVERVSDRGGVLRMAEHPQFERLQTAEREPAVERRRDRAGGVLQELDRLEDARVTREDRALDEVGVTGQVLRHAVHDDVGAELEGLLKERRGKRVVDDQQRPARVCGGGDGGNVVHQ